MTQLDKRLHAYRPDLADARLRGKVEAAGFSEGEIRTLTGPLAGLHREPRFDSMQLTQVLMGERLRVFDAREGWAWVQLESDGYVGYLSEDMLGPATEVATHTVGVPSAFMFPAPHIKSQPVTTLPMNAAVRTIKLDGEFAQLANGQFIAARHLRPVGSFEADYVAVAERFLHVPYLWGGKSVMGLDCSGLVQLSLQAAGIPCPRDTDMQEKALGKPVAPAVPASLRRGDLVFWKGHVGIMTDAEYLLHANGHFMQVTKEPLEVAIDRIAKSDGRVTSIRRL
jgi:cell wall-associated NlpC family hydrolase